MSRLSGRGSPFRLEIDALPQLSLGEYPLGAQAHGDLQPMRILIVDDHPMVLTGCQHIFNAQNGFEEVVGAADIDAGLSTYLAMRPDVAILDISLPGGSGFELTKRILRHDPKARVVIFSMNDEKPFVVQAIQAGAKRFVSKCDDPRNLVHAVLEIGKAN
jgi:DNA-binding NarL/FixJ family response regulator